MKRLILPVALGFGLAACAPALVSAPAELAEVFPAEAIDEVARIVEMEDRREFDREAFRGAIQSPLPAVRRRALLALGRIGGREGRGLVEPRLWDPDTSVVATAAFATGLLVDSAATDRLRELAGPPNDQLAPTVAVAAVHALTAIGTPAAVEAIRSLLRDADPELPRDPAPVQAALSSLARLQPRANPWERWLTAPEPGIVAAALRAAPRAGDPLPLATLEPFLASPDTQVRAATASVFTSEAVDAAGFPVARAASTLQPLLADPDYATRIAAWRSVATYALPNLRAAVEEALRGASGPERLAALEGLASSGQPPGGSLGEAVRAIAFDSAQPHEIRLQALQVVEATIPDADLSALAGADEWRIRSWARDIGFSRGLAGFGLRDALLDRDPRVGANVLAGVVQRTEPADLRRYRSELWEAIHHNDAAIRAAAARGIGKAGDISSTPVLLDAYAASVGDPDVIAALSAVDALGELGLRTGLPTQRAFFARFGRADDYRVRQRVLDRLGSNQQWGKPVPLETSLGPGVYRELIASYLAGTDSTFVPEMTLLTAGDTISIELFAADAPLHVSRLIQMTQLRFFDGIQWSSARPGGLLTTGDRDTRQGEGSGFSIRGEAGRRRAEIGSVGMVDGPDAAAGELFIVLGPEAALPPAYTVVGRVTTGLPSLRVAVAGDRIDRLSLPGRAGE